MVKRITAAFLAMVLLLGAYNVLGKMESYAIIAVEKFSIGQGYMLEPKRVKLFEGETAAEFFVRVIGEEKFEADLSWGLYLTGIKDFNMDSVPTEILERCELDGVFGRSDDGWLRMGDYTNSSCYLYTVNDISPPKGMSDYVLENGDVLRIQYSMYGWGADIGLGYDINYVNPVDKADITRKLADLADYKIWFSNDDKILYKNALEIVTNGASSDEEILSARNLLNEIKVYLMEKTVNHIMATAPTSKYGMEWRIVGIARSLEYIPESYFDMYYQNVVQKVENSYNTLSITESAKLVLALSAIGRDPKNVSGYNLTNKLENPEEVIAAGINGVIYALIALDSKNYGSQSARDALIEYIIEQQLEDGGFTLDRQFSTTGDPDMTAAVLIALAKYRDNSNVATVIDDSLMFLSETQDADGGFSSYGAANACSPAQVLTALSALGIDAKSDVRFIKNSNTVISALRSYMLEDGGFKNAAEDNWESTFATEQAMYAMAAYKRFRENKPALFDMSEVGLNIAFFNDMIIRRIEDERIVYRGISTNEQTYLYIAFHDKNTVDDLKVIKLGTEGTIPLTEYDGRHMELFIWKKDKTPLCKKIYYSPEV